MTKFKNLIQVYGAERSGKSTFCDCYYTSSSLKKIHFGVPSDFEQGSLSNYILNLEEGYEITLTDRGPLEANIFRPIPLIDIRNELVSYISLFETVEFVIIERDFEELIDLHFEEILEVSPDFQKWKVESLLQKVRIEHYTYYQKLYENIYNLYDLFQPHNTEGIKITHINN